MNTLVRLIYRSRVAAGFQSEQLNDVIRSARQHNAPVGITGLLVFDARNFLQVLEGPSAAVNSRYVRIARDDRHYEVRLLHFGDIDSRRFEDWSMGLLGLDERTTRLLVKYTPDGMIESLQSGHGALELMTQLGCELRARRYLTSDESQMASAAV
jgi:Sensors of blue-light using FAD